MANMARQRDSEEQRNVRNVALVQMAEAGHIPHKLAFGGSEPGC